MELKDVILSTLAEMDDAETVLQDDTPKEEKSVAAPQQKETHHLIDHDEELWLESVRERLLVLFEGFQSPNNVQIEAKVDLSLNFLEYLLANIDTRLERIKGKTDDGDL